MRLRSGTDALDVLELHLGALVCGGVLYGEDDVFVVKVFWTEAVDMCTTLVLGVTAVLAVVAVATVETLGSTLLLLGNTACLLFGMLLEVVGHAVDIFDAEACSKDSDLDLLAKLWVDGESPLEFKAATETIHEVIDIVHLVHGEGLVLCTVLAGEGYGDEYLLGVVDVLVVEQR